MTSSNPKKNVQLMGRNQKYNENYIIEVNSVHDVFEFEPKDDTFEFEKEKQ